MEIPVTLLVPEPLYRQAETLAVAAHKTVAQVLLEQLTEGRPLPLTTAPDQEQAILEQEVAAYQTLHARLVERYLGQWVAIHQGQLVDHDGDEEALMVRLAQAFPEQIILVRLVETEPGRAIYIPSFHFVP